VSYDADVVIIGAGIAGVSTAFYLSARHDIHSVIIVDPRPPLTLTSDKSTECYRNWWPNASMVGLMNRSIDLLVEMAAETGDVFNLKQPGYLYVTANPETFERMGREAEAISALGAGQVRRHPGPDPYGIADNGVDLLSRDELSEHHSYITEEAIGALQIRRAGYFSAQQLGAWMLEQAKANGVRVVAAEATGIGVEDGRVTNVRLDDGAIIKTRTLVMAAGPMAKPVAAMAGVKLPLESELHIKVTFRDHLRVVPRNAGMFIWADPQRLDWSDEERTALIEMGRTDVTGDMPIHCHGRPEGGPESPYFVGLWEYQRNIIEPTWPLPTDELFPEVVMKGLRTMIPGLSPYLKGLPEHDVDGGYYTKTKENRPLIGPCGPTGFHVVCGFSGFGVMVASGAGDLAARHIARADLPDYADDFLLSRYQRHEYTTMIDALESGQL